MSRDPTSNLNPNGAPAAHVAVLGPVDPVALARGEARLAMLKELVDIGVERVHELSRVMFGNMDRAQAESAGVEGLGAFDRVSRAVCLGMALVRRAQEDLDVILAGGAAGPTQSERDTEAQIRAAIAPPPPKAPSAPRDPGFPNPDTIVDDLLRGLYREVDAIYKGYGSLDPEEDFDESDGEDADWENEHERERRDDGRELLAEANRQDKLVNGPLKAAIASICKDLGLRPDWSLWTEDGGLPAPQEGLRRRWARFWGLPPEPLAEALAQAPGTPKRVEDARPRPQVPPPRPDEIRRDEIRPEPRKFDPTVPWSWRRE